MAPINSRAATQPPGHLPAAHPLLTPAHSTPRAQAWSPHLTAGGASEDIAAQGPVSSAVGQP